MLTPKEQAKELVYDMYKCMPVNDAKIGSEEPRAMTQAMEQLSAKQCATVCIDKILKGSRLFYIEDYDYWKEVKQELNK